MERGGASGFNTVSILLCFPCRFRRNYGKPPFRVDRVRYTWFRMRVVVCRSTCNRRGSSLVALPPKFPIKPTRPCLLTTVVRRQGGGGSKWIILHDYRKKAPKKIVKKRKIEKRCCSVVLTYRFRIGCVTFVLDVRRRWFRPSSIIVE